MVRAEQVRAARALLAISQEELAKLAGVVRITIARLENEAVPTQPLVLARIVEALESKGVRFLTLEDGASGVVLDPAARPTVAGKPLRKPKGAGPHDHPIA